MGWPKEPTLISWEGQNGNAHTNRVSRIRASVSPMRILFKQPSLIPFLEVECCWLPPSCVFFSPGSTLSLLSLLVFGLDYSLPTLILGVCLPFRLSTTGSSPVRPLAGINQLSWIGISSYRTDAVTREHFTRLQQKTCRAFGSRDIPCYFPQFL